MEGSCNIWFVSRRNLLFTIALFKVGHVLGKGGFGIVYAGVRNKDGLQVAIKHIAKAKIKDWGQVGLLLYSERHTCDEVGAVFVWAVKRMRRTFSLSK